MKTHVVKYPGGIKRIGIPMEYFKQYKVYKILSKAGLPEGTLFLSGHCNEPGKEHSLFTIILPSGEAFSGFAIKSPRDEHNDVTEAALCIAAGRAVAVWKAQGELPEEMQYVYDALHKEQMYVAEALEKVVSRQIALDEGKAKNPPENEILLSIMEYFAGHTILGVITHKGFGGETVTTIKSRERRK